MGHKPHVDVWGTETADVEMDEKKVRGGERGPLSCFS